MLQIHVVTYTVAMKVQIVQSFLLLTAHLTSAGQCYPYGGRSKNKQSCLNMLTTKKTANHAECYKKCTALGRNTPPKNGDVESKSIHTRLKSTLVSASSSTGIMPKICISCTKKDKKHNGSKQKLVSVKTGNFEEKIKKYARTLGDQALLSKLGSVDFATK